MSNRNANRVNQDLEREGRRVGSEYDQYNQRRNTLADDARTRSDAVFSQTLGGYQDFINRAKSGGFGRGPSSSRGYYKDFAETGGLDEENKRRIRGNGGFDEFAKTGGYNDADKTNIRSRALRTTPSFYDNVRNELDRANRQQGGGNPAFDASTAAIARQSSQATADASSDAEFGIMDRVNEGRKWGIGGMSDAETKLSDLLQRGKLAGAEGLSREDMADYDASSRGAELELGALGGMRGLRTDTPGEVALYEDAVSGGMAGGAGARRGILNDRMAYNPNRSFAERLSPYLNMAGGVAGTLMGGPGGGVLSRGMPTRNTGVRGGGFGAGTGYNIDPQSTTLSRSRWF